MAFKGSISCTVVVQVDTVDVVEFTFVAFEISDGTLEDTFAVLLLDNKDDRVTGATEVIVTDCSEVVSVELFVVFRFADDAFKGKMVNSVGSDVVDETGNAVVEDVAFAAKSVRTVVVESKLVAFVGTNKSNKAVVFNKGAIEFEDTVLFKVVVLVTQTVVFVTLLSCLLPSVNVETISQGTFSASVLPSSLIFNKQTAAFLGLLSGM